MSNVQMSYFKCKIIFEIIKKQKTKKLIKAKYASKSNKFKSSKDLKNGIRPDFNKAKSVIPDFTAFSFGFSNPNQLINCYMYVGYIVIFFVRNPKKK
jgi:hypothetical protein